MALGEVLRQERKFDLTAAEAARCRRLLECYLHPDPHNGPHGYLVRSLYFDTLLDKDYHEKADGCAQRRKMRLRIYSPHDDFALLEMKQKDCAQQRKRSLRLSRADAEAVAAGRYASLLSYPDPFAAECHAVLETLFYRPRVVIEYRRTAYILPTNSIRITFDRDIRSAAACLDLFADPFMGAPVFPAFHTVLEVKYNHFLPAYVREALRGCDGSESSASKYGMGRTGSFFRTP